MSENPRSRDNESREPEKRAGGKIIWLDVLSVACAVVQCILDIIEMTGN